MFVPPVFVNVSSDSRSIEPGPEFLERKDNIGGENFDQDILGNILAICRIGA